MRKRLMLCVCFVLAFTLGMNISSADNERIQLDNPPTVDENTVLLLHFDESRGTKANDSSKYGNHGTLTNMNDRDWVEGKFGNALHFNGVDAFIDCGNNPSLNFGGDITVEAWIKMKGDQFRRPIINNISPVGGYALEVMSGQIVFWAKKADGNSHWFFGTTKLTTGTWYHIVVAYGKGGIQFYLNGWPEAIGATSLLTPTGRISKPINELIGRPLEAGKSHTRIGTIYGMFFNGLIDEVRVSNRVRYLHAYQPKVTFGEIAPNIVLGRIKAIHKLDFDNLPRYAISFWISPVDWRGSSVEGRRFITIRGRSGEMVFYKERGRQARHDLLGVFAGKGRLAVTIKEPPREYELRFTLDRWAPTGFYPLEKWAGHTDFDRFPKAEWIPGQWHHVLINMDRYLRRADLFIDGALMSSHKGVRIVEDLEEIVFEGNPWGKTLIDNFTILKYPLGVAEVDYIFSRGNKPLPLPFPEEVELKPQIYRRMVYLYQKLWTGVDARDRADTVEMVLSKGGERILTKRVEGGSGGYFQAIFDVKDLPLGMYVLKGTLYKEGEKVGEVKTTFDRVDKTTWETAKEIGNTGQVLRPWTPLVLRDGRIIECWGREYWWSNEGKFIERIISQGEDILASPMRFDAFSGGKKVNWILRDYRVVKEDPAEIVLNTKHMGKNISLSVSYRTEFDGTIFMDIELAPQVSEALIDSFSLVLPFRTEFARYLVYHNHSAVLDIPFMAGFGCIWDEDPIPVAAMRSTEGFTIEGNRRMMFFVPWLYLGNADLGFSFGTEEMRNWATDERNEQRMIELVKEGEKTTLYLNLIRRDEPFRLDRPLQWTIAIQATPLKPLYPRDVRDWRAIRYSSNPFMGNMSSHPHPNILESWLWSWAYGQGGNRIRDRQGMRKLVEYFRQKGIMYYPHAVMQNSSETEPEIWGNLEEFMRTPGIIWSTNVGGFYFAQARGDRDLLSLDVFRREKGNLKDTPLISHGLLITRTCVGSERYRDFLVWSVKYGAEQMGFKGIHWDVGGIAPCLNEQHGCGYICINNKKRPTWPIFAHRDLLRRNLATFQERGIDPKISGAVFPRATISTGFSNDIQTGEWWIFPGGGGLEGLCLLDKLSLADYRALLSPVPTGIPLAHFTAYRRGKYTPAQAESMLRAYYMLSLLHDIKIFEIPQYQQLGQEVLLAQYKFGMADTIFLPYWRITGREVKVSNPEKIKVSMYVKEAKDKALVVIGNIADEAINEKIIIDMESLGLKSRGVLTDMLTGELVSGKPSFTVNVDGRGFRLLVLE